MEIRVGMLGFGETGRRHALAWRALALSGIEGLTVRLVGVTAPDAEDAVAQGGFAWGTADPEELISHPDIDVLDLCGPPEARADALRSAMAAGKHIYCARPMTADLRETEELAARAYRTTGVRQMASPLRWLPGVDLAKRLIEMGAIGEPHTLHVVRDGEAGDGSLMDLLPEALDVVRAWNGEVAEVCAVGGALPEGAEAACSLSGLVRFENGSTGTMMASRCAASFGEAFRAEIAGSEGALRFDAARPFDVLIACPGEGAPELQWERAPDPLKAPAGLAGDVASLAAFVRAIGQEERADPGFRDGLIAARIVEALRESAEAGEWVPIDLGR